MPAPVKNGRAIMSRDTAEPDASDPFCHLKKTRRLPDKLFESLETKRGARCHER